MSSSRPWLLLAIAALVPACSTAPDRERIAPALEPAAAMVQTDLGRFFAAEGVAGTFVLHDPATGRTLRHDAERARTRFPPASTFKIPNMLIALETGVAGGADFLLSRDTLSAPQQAWWPAVWMQDHTLRSAVPGSVVWYFQELARRIGPDRMQDYVDRFGYGNRSTSGGIDHFWLTGGLQISADEQVGFLRRFYEGELGLSAHSTMVARELLVLEETPAYRLSGKTGWAGLGEPDSPQVGWLVGYVERGAEVHFFATNIDIRTGADAAARLAITRAILSDLGLLQ